LLDLLEPLHACLGERLWIAPSCSLLHVPVDLAGEEGLDPEQRSWLAFATQKLEEVCTLKQALERGRAAVSEALARSDAAVAARRDSGRLHRAEVRERVAVQRQRLGLPLFPTTTIGSFPRTAEIRAVRRDFKAGPTETAAYEGRMREEIAEAVRQQEALGLDVLVYGEPERNDIVEGSTAAREGDRRTRAFGHPLTVCNRIIFGGSMPGFLPAGVGGGRP